MKAVIQRVSQAAVTVEGAVVGSIGKGLMILLGVHARDERPDADYLAEKIVHLRIFEDEDGKMNRSLLDCGGEVLAISQFTLYANTRKGRRPSFIEAAPPAMAEELYRYFMEALQKKAVSVKKGVFGANMSVSLVNEGPVTIILDSEDRQQPRRQASS
ncbi:MAG TPA: D-aminoacyl-tRNA deacylase [Calditrichia bacterium]|nr:D-aminoacyl-tRNA deacylase [Calditrichia bacterium]